MVHIVMPKKKPEKTHDLVIRPDRQSVRVGLGSLPASVLQAGDEAIRAFLEFFTATIRNKNTRAAYARAVGQFLRWCEGRGLGLRQIEPITVASYIETHPGSAPTV